MPLRSGAAAGPGAGREDDRVGVADRGRDGRCVSGLEVADDRVAAGLADVGLVVGVADQRAHAVAALGQQARQPQRDLPVPSCDRHQHAQARYA